MLDLDHPRSPFIFRASGCMDVLLQAEQTMCRVSDAERLLILAKCQPVFVELRELNRQHFENSDFISSALRELEAVFGELALPDASREENLRGENSKTPCARCGKPLLTFDSLVRFPGHNSLITFCPFCSKLADKAREKLAGPQGFGTVFI